jgi:hypothetical protein
VAHIKEFPLRMNGTENYKYGPVAKESRSGRRKHPWAQVLK